MHRRRQRSGFTMAEVLIALAITVVLLALAIPGVAALSCRMKLSERDSVARQLFIQAQSQLLLAKAGGTLASIDGSALTAQPADFPAELAWQDDGYAYLEGAAAKELLPALGIDAAVAKGHYVIEYHRQTGMVYAVFYSEEPFSYSAAMPRDWASRLDAMVGYYGGSGAEEGGMEKAPQASLSMVNEEDLYAAIIPQAGVKYTLQVSDTAGNVGKEYTFTASDMLQISDRYPNEMSYTKGEYRLYLDRLEGDGFSTRFPSLVPGADVRVTAVTERVAGEGLPATVSAVENSLFQAVNAGSALVSWSRHLQNLSPDVSGVGGSVTSAVQAADITWRGSGDFIPITNASLTSFDGSGLTLAGFPFGQQNGYSGLFGSFTGSAITRVRLVDCWASGDYAGVLAGSVSGAELSDCMAYLVYALGKSPKDYAVRGESCAGGLVGYARETSFARCCASVPVVQAAGASGYAGGLVGSGDGLRFQQCYAASGWASSPEGLALYGGVSAPLGNAGGLVGFAPQGELQDCYAAGKVAGAYAGGMAGRNESTSYVGCYAAALVEGTQAGYPFSPGNPSGIYCYYLAVPEVEEQEGTGIAACSVEELRTCLKDGAWSKGTEAATKPYGMTGAYPYPRLTALVHHGDWVLAEEPPQGDFEGLVYYEYYQDRTYGFYADGQGDTLSDVKTLVSDGYAFIRPTGKEPLEVVYKYNSGTASYPDDSTIASATTILSRAEDASGRGQQVYLMTPDGAVLKQSSARDGATFFHTLWCEGETYYFQPNFAKTAVNGAVARPSDPPAQIEVRTARHLAQMGHIPHGYAAEVLCKQNYLQSRPIDFVPYIPAQTMSPMFREYPYFSGVYDGAGNVITGTDIISSGENVGLFGTLCGTLKNIVFLSDLNRDKPREIRGGTNVGGLIGKLQSGGNLKSGGYVENCLVAGFAIIGEDAVGGFAGAVLNDSNSIRNCAAVNGYFQDGTAGGYVKATNENPSVGGFFGQGGVSTNCCYAVGRVFATGPNVAGFAHNSHHASLRNSYCAVVNGAGEYLAFSSDNKNANSYAYDGSNGQEIIAALTDVGDWTMITETGRSHRYETPSTEDIYPLPAIYQAQDEFYHYGNWPEKPEPADEGLYYYEKYTNGTYGFYAMRGGEEISSLSDSFSVEEDGYAYLTQDNAQTPKTVKYHGSKWNNDTTSISISSTRVIETTGAPRYAVLLTPRGDVLEKSISLDKDDNLYHRVYISGTLYFYHPHFAKTAHADITVAPAVPDYFELRTARQLARLGAISDSEEKTLFVTQNFSQTRDIDFATYTTSLTLTPILGHNGYQGVFDGGGHNIRNISIMGTSERTGLFAWLKGGTLRDIHISNGTLKGTTAVGALLGQAEAGAVVGCTVSNVTVSGRECVGGLIGDLLQGTVDQCAVTGVTATASGNYCGGLSGRTDKQGTAVTRCAVEIGAEGSVTGVSGVGGLIGRNGSAAVTDCTVYGYVGDFAGAAGTVKATNSVGGLIGISNMAGVRLTDNTVIGANVTASGDYAGGFIGSSTGVTIEGCTVYNPSNDSVSGAITIKGASYVGGFGGNGGSYYSSCAAAGLAVDGKNFVGGFVGQLTGGGSVTGCAAANGFFGSQSSAGGTIISTGTVNIGGFAGAANGTIANSYAVARLEVKAISATSAFVGSGSGTLTNCYAISQNGIGAYLGFGTGWKFTGCVAYDGDNGDMLRNAFASNSAFAFPTADTTMANDESLASSAYPYPSAVRRGGKAWHYGNWPE